MTTPSLRFKADDGSKFPEWNAITLGDCGYVAMCKRVYKRQTNITGEIPFFKIGTFGGTPDAYISRELFNELKSKYPYPQKGAVLLSASGTIGRAIVFDGNDAYFQDSNIVWLEHDGTVLDSFLLQFYQVVNWQGLEGGTIKRLYNKIILDTKFCRPCIEEQRKITGLLSAVDEVIAQQQAEVVAWERYKQGVAHKLFAQEVHFKADDGSTFPQWEQKRFGDIMTCYSGGTPRTSEKSYYGGSIPFLKSGEIHSSDTEDHITELGLLNSSAKLISKGDLIYALYGATSGDVAISKMDAAINQAILCIVPYHDNRTYLKHWLELKRSSITSKYLQGGQGNLSAELVKSLIIPMPSLAEQRKIAECLGAIDEVIALAKAELEKWRELKKGLLQQLFV